MRKILKAREGDLIENKVGLILDVKGLVHPPSKVISFPRFIPSLQGNRKQGSKAYRKIYALSDRFEFLEKNHPQYIVHDSVFDETLCEVPVEDIEVHYDPIARLQDLKQDEELNGLEACALECLGQLNASARIGWGSLGISGSLLVKLHKPSSDIDPVIYGRKNCLKAYEALRGLLDGSKDFENYSSEELERLYRFRFQDTRVPFEDFLRTETRKAMQGNFKGRDYFVRFLKDWSEVQEAYGAVQYRNLGYARISAEIEDDSEAIFTPCSYKIRDVRILEGPKSYRIKEIASFRGRFCDQASIGERVIAQGKVERVTHTCAQDEKRLTDFRLLLGNKRSDFMILA